MSLKHSEEAAIKVVMNEAHSLVYTLRRVQDLNIQFGLLTKQIKVSNYKAG